MLRACVRIARSSMTPGEYARSDRKPGGVGALAGGAGAVFFVVVGRGVAVAAEQFQVAELVAAAVAERDAVVDLEPPAGAAADADAVAGVDLCGDAVPLPAGADLSALGPAVASSLAVGAA